MNYLTATRPSKDRLAQRRPGDSHGARCDGCLYGSKLHGRRHPLRRRAGSKTASSPKKAAPSPPSDLDRHPDITAIFAGNDKMAIGALHYLSRRGHRRCRRICRSIGFDDLQHAAFVTPTLTTVHLPLYQVGSLACERLIERIRGRSEPVAETLSTHLVVRESTAMARQLINSISTTDTTQMNTDTKHADRHLRRFLSAFICRSSVVAYLRSSPTSTTFVYDASQDATNRGRCSSPAISTAGRKTPRR